jgi:hypothetical protein
VLGAVTFTVEFIESASRLVARRAEVSSACVGAVDPFGRHWDRGLLHKSGRDASAPGA